MRDDREPVGPAALSSALASLYGELDEDGPLVARVAAESGLEPVALRRFLRDWAAGIDEAALLRLSRTAQRPANATTRLLTLAPGNIPIVGAECLLLGLLAGGHHALALSTRASALPIALSAHLARVVGDLDARLELVVWRRLSPAERSGLLGGATRIVAYGTAETIEHVADRMAASAALVPHGPSVALAYLDPDGLDGADLDRCLMGLAADVARWDQRGCRSPHALMVRGDRATASRLATLLANEALPQITERWPRGRLTPGETAAGYLDRLTSRSLGQVLARPGFCVTIEHQPRVLRPSPLGRTLRVVGVGGPADVDALAATLHAPVGALAVGGERPSAVLPNTAPLERVACGELQTPAFDRLHDGRHRLDELRDLSPG